MNTFENYTGYANPIDVFGKCYKSQPLKCLWSQPMVAFFNNSTVKAQLHIPQALQANPWIPCSTAENSDFNYTLNAAGSWWIYQNIIDSGYRILKYSGDADSYVPTVGTQKWINELNWNVTKEWSPYFIPMSPTVKQVAGYYESRGNFTFATVHGAGHMAAKQKKQQTFKAVFNFINQ